jgi:mono/diheme cytochrome c family protein
MDREVMVGGHTQRWHFPSRTECMVCHTRAANFVLGLCELQMAKEHDYPAGHPRSGSVRDHQLRTLEHLGLLQVDWAAEAKGQVRERAKAKGLTGAAAEEYVRAHLPQPGQREPKPSSLLAQPPARAPALADPYDRSQDLTLRARSWLHANCSACHVEAGGGNAQMELEFTTALEKMRVVNTAPLHETFGLRDAKLIAPGDAGRSILAHRAGLRGPGQMPPLASQRIDAEGVELLRAWIYGMAR